MSVVERLLLLRVAGMPRNGIKYFQVKNLFLRAAFMQSSKVSSFYLDYRGTPPISRVSRLSNKHPPEIDTSPDELQPIFSSHTLKYTIHSLVQF